jgi:hypothetical protein
MSAEVEANLPQSELTVFFASLVFNTPVAAGRGPGLRAAPA